MKIDLNYLLIFGIPMLIFMSIGTFLDALTNILEWFILSVSIIGTVIAVVLFFTVKVLIRQRRLFLGESRLSRIRNLNSGFIGLLITLWIPQLFSPFSDKMEDNIETEDQISEIFDKSHKLRILLLPFHPDVNCQIQKTDYERQIIERYRQKAENEDLELGIYFLSEDLCPITKNDAKKLAEENKADLVIWGQYEDNCYEESNLRIRYSLAFDFYNAEQRPFAKDPSQFQPNPLEYGDTDKRKHSANYTSRCCSVAIPLPVSSGIQCWGRSSSSSERG